MWLQNKRINSQKSPLRKNTITKITDRNIWLLAIVIVAIGLGPTLSSVAFALTEADDPHGPMEIYAWGAGIAVAGVMAGAGIFTTVRKR